MQLLHHNIAKVAVEINGSLPVKMRKKDRENSCKHEFYSNY